MDRSRGVWLALAAAFVLLGAACSSANSDDDDGDDFITYEPATGGTVVGPTLQPGTDDGSGGGTDEGTDDETNSGSDDGAGDTSTDGAEGDDAADGTADDTATDDAEPDDTTTNDDAAEAEPGALLARLGFPNLINDLEDDCDEQVADWADAYGQHFLGQPRLTPEGGSLALGTDGDGSGCPTVRAAIRALCDEEVDPPVARGELAPVLRLSPKTLTASQWEHAYEVMCAGGVDGEQETLVLEGTVTFNNQPHEVGVDIYAGTWHLDSHPDGCTWEISDSADGAPSSSGVGADAPVELEVGDFFTVEGCGWWVWSRGEPPAVPARTFSANGVYVVGADIAAGTWTRMGKQFEFCHLAVYPEGARLGDPDRQRLGEFGPAYNSASPTGAFEVELLEGDRLSVSQQCGEWVLP